MHIQAQTLSTHASNRRIRGRSSSHQVPTQLELPPKTLCVVDTNVLIGELNILIQIRETRGLFLVVPNVVMYELDNLKVHF